MHHGISMFPTAYSMQPAELAQAAEERGFDSIWFPEHTHIPVSRETPWPGGGPLPQEYCDTYDPFIALAMAAAAFSPRAQMSMAPTWAAIKSAGSSDWRRNLASKLVPPVVKPPALRMW